MVDPWNSLPENYSVCPKPNILERRLDKFWDGQELKYDFKKCLKILYKNNAPYPETGTDDEERDEKDLAIVVP